MNEKKKKKKKKIVKKAYEKFDKTDTSAWAQKWKRDETKY